jgi:hypothetical protein
MDRLLLLQDGTGKLLARQAAPGSAAGAVGASNVKRLPDANPPANRSNA